MTKMLGLRQVSVEVGSCSIPSTLAMPEGPLRILDSEERNRLKELRQPGDQVRFVASRALLRRALSRSQRRLAPGEWHFKREASGRWRLDPQSDSLFFSTAHCQSAAAVAVSKSSRVGIDVEDLHQEIDPDSISAALTPGELAWLKSFPTLEQSGKTIRLWSAKEAYTKLTGLGADLDPLSFEVQFTTPGASLARIVCEGTEVAQVSSMEMPLRGKSYLYSIATENLATLVFQRPDEVCDA